MSDIRGKIAQIYSLEQLASGRSAVHRLHPLVKILSVLWFLVCVVSFDRYSFVRLAPYVFFPVVMIALADIPWLMIATRLLVALPFCLFAGLSNLLLDRSEVLRIGGIAVSSGLLSLATILLRTFLCVAAVLVLIAVTPFSELTAGLRRLRVPLVLIQLFEMTYRYIGVLLGEAAGMATAYKLRGGRSRGIELRHMGSFVGRLLLRSIDRAERVYHAMECRGYPSHAWKAEGIPLRGVDYAYLAAVCLPALLLRLADVPALLTAGLSGVLS